MYASCEDWAEHREPLDDIALSADSTVEISQEGGEVKEKSFTCSSKGCEVQCFARYNMFCDKRGGHTYLYLVPASTGATRSSLPTKARVDAQSWGLEEVEAGSFAQVSWWKRRTLSACRR